MDAHTHVPFDNYLFDFRGNRFPNHNHYYYFKNGFSEKECQEILESFSKFCKVSSKVFGDNETSTRRSKIFWIPRNNTTQWIYDRLVSLAANANSAMFGFDLSGLRDNIQLTFYDGEEGGKYDRHIDLGANDVYACRKLSLTVQLSSPDHYEGGNVILNDSVPFPRGRGDVAVFSAFTPHKVEKVTRGKRYSLVLWVYGPPFR